MPSRPSVLYVCVKSFLSPRLSGALGFIALIIMGSVWLGLTIGILCVMEVTSRVALNINNAQHNRTQGLSAFLHALCLHWVEANGKHYEAGGYAFPHRAGPAGCCRGDKSRLHPRAAPRVRQENVKACTHHHGCCSSMTDPGPPRPSCRHMPSHRARRVFVWQ